MTEFVFLYFLFSLFRGYFYEKKEKVIYSPTILRQEVFLLLLDGCIVSLCMAIS